MNFERFASATILTAMLGVLGALAVGCAKKETSVSVDTATGQRVDYVGSDDAEEFCYKGVVYVRFTVTHSTKSSWGGAKFNSDGEVATCQVIGK